MRYSVALAGLVATLAPGALLAAPDHGHHHAAADPAAAITAAIADPARSAANRARDTYRHPAETLAFFEVAPHQNIVEFLPGGGWYTEILAPLVRNHGRYTALVANTPQATTKITQTLAAAEGRYGKTNVATFDYASGASSLAPGSVDRILTFRNVHNLLMANEATAAHAFAAFYAALKPGGILGVVDHRLPETADTAREKTSGYIKRSTVLRLAQAAGFTLAGESAVNANPKDSADWPKGVWTLPPTLTLGDTDRARYVAIGESDRMTLKFVKPAR